MGEKYRRFEMPNSSAELNADLFEETKKMKKKKITHHTSRKKRCFQSQDEKTPSLRIVG
jgi:hypothetical protein